MAVAFKPLEPDPREKFYVNVADPGVDLLEYDPREWTPLRVFKTQPSVRKVIDFIASNVASIPLHVYSRESDINRERVTTGALAEVVARPSVAREEGPYKFWYRFIHDWLLYDRAVAFIDQVNGKLMRIPPSEYKLKVNRFGLIYRVDVSDGVGGWDEFDPEHFLIQAGYSTANKAGYSRVNTLEGLLKEMSEGVEYRNKAMRKALTHTGIVQRETEWPSIAARQNFLESLRRFDADGKDAGKTMLLDDGMIWKDRALPLQEKTHLSVLEARKLTDAEVCGLFHIQPEMLGIRPGTFANMEAFRQALYRDNLGPYIVEWEQAVAPLVDVFGEPGMYVEAMLEAKLRGSFEEQTRTMSSATGAPWLTRNEARAKQNLPAIDGGDELVVPLNVLTGGQASPRDSAPEPKSVKTSATGFKSRDFETPQVRQRFETMFERFFERQKRSILSALNGKNDWWDGGRWDRELGEDIFQLAVEVTSEIGASQAVELGFDAEDYSVGQTLNFLKTVARNRAQWVNQTTKRKIDSVLEAVDGDVNSVFEEAVNARTLSAGRALTATLTGWTATEVVKQTVGKRGVKTWLTNSKNPRASHARMHGETVGVYETFSNGMQWPGDPVGGVDEVAGCCCGVEVTIKD